MDAAAIVFAEKGFHPTTIHDIAKQAGVADGTIYNYFDSKSALLEQFKSSNAVLKNSLRYFPVVTGQLLDHCSASHQVTFCRDVEQLQRTVLVYNLYGDPEVAANIQQRLSQVRAHLAKMPALLGEETSTVIHHTENILRIQPRVDDLIRSILTAPISATADNLSRAYDNAHSQAMKRSGNYRSLLYALSILLLGYEFYSLARPGIRGTGAARHTP